MSKNIIYCFKTSCNTTNTSIHDDYAVYKVGKTSRNPEKRMKEHEEYLVNLLFNKEVFSCDSIEKYLLKTLKKHPQLKQIKNIKNCKSGAIRGNEYFEGRYLYIKEVLDEVTSDIFQCENIQDMNQDHICEICNRVFESKQGLKQHITKIHNKKLILSTPIKLKTTITKSEKSNKKQKQKVIKDSTFRNDDLYPKRNTKKVNYKEKSSSSSDKKQYSPILFYFDKSDKKLKRQERKDLFNTTTSSKKKSTEKSIKESSKNIDYPSFENTFSKLKISDKLPHEKPIKKRNERSTSSDTPDRIPRKHKDKKRKDIKVNKHYYYMKKIENKVLEEKRIKK
jgi:hypothetical protein